MGEPGFLSKICPLIVLWVAFVSCDVERCPKSLTYSNGCGVVHVSANFAPCELILYTAPAFTLFIKPDRVFRKIEFKMSDFVTPFKESNGSSWVIGEVSDHLELGQDIVPSTKTWYKVDLRPSHEDLQPILPDLILENTFSVYVDGVLRAKKTLSFTNPSHVSVRVDGSLYYSSGCNPQRPPVSTMDVNAPKSLSTHMKLVRTSIPQEHQSREWVLNEVTLIIGSLVLVAVIVAVIVILKRKKREPEELSEDINENGPDAVFHI